MANPVLVSIPEWTWINIAEQVKYLKIYRQNTTVYYYKTYRQNGEDPPDDPTVGTIPDDAIKIFQESYLDCVESSESIDVYIMCANQDDDDDETGSVIVGEVDDFRDISKQDQTTPGVIQKFNQVHDSTVLSADVVIASPDDFVYDIEVADATGIVIGSHIILFNPILLRFSTFTALAVNGLIITLDSPIDAAYPAGTFVDVAITDLSVDGSTTPQVFGLRGTGVIPGVEIKVDITRIIISCLTTNAVDLSKFGDIVGGLTRGLLLRFRNGDVFNIFNVKTNGELDNITLDWVPYSAQNIQQGQHGFTCRLTFNGDDKLGIVERLRAGEDIELIVQDNLLTILRLTVYGEGHIVLP